MLLQIYQRDKEIIRLEAQTLTNSVRDAVRILLEAYFTPTQLGDLNEWLESGKNVQLFLGRDYEAQLKENVD